MKQDHGADLYSPDGRPARLLDFSSTVVEIDPPKGWQALFTRHLSGLARYPQPYASGLAAHIEKKLGLAGGSVLVGNGSSECLEWIAMSLRGRDVLLESPCFGEYEQWLYRHGASVKEIGADEPYSPEWPRVRQALKKSHAYFTAHPSNPAGLAYSRAEFLEELAYCREKKILLVLDEALRAQQLKAGDEAFLKAVCKAPGALVVRSLGKGLKLPGLRLGFVAGHPREVAKLGRFVNPWSVGSLAQAVGAWAFDQESGQLKARARRLASHKRDLLKRLEAFAGRLLPFESETGYFLVRLVGRDLDSLKLAAKLARHGVLVRSCASYGGWGRGFIRLNPRRPVENAKLARALKACL